MKVTPQKVFICICLSMSLLTSAMFPLASDINLWFFAAVVWIIYGFKWCLAFLGLRITLMIPSLIDVFFWAKGFFSQLPFFIESTSTKLFKIIGLNTTAYATPPMPETARILFNENGGWLAIGWYFLQYTAYMVVCRVMLKKIFKRYGVGG